MDLPAFLSKISIWAIPVLVAITLHEVAHGWTARYFGDRTAELLGRLSLNPLRHIDPIGTVLVPLLLLAASVVPIGWARPVPVATQGLRNPRAVTILIAAAGPVANLAMASLWCALLSTTVHLRANATLLGWLMLMAQEGIVINLVLAVFNLLPIPPLDGGRIVAALLPSALSARLDKLEPLGLVVALALVAFNMLGWMFDPTYRVVGRIVNVLFGSSA